MFKHTKEEALELIRKAIYLLAGSIDQSQDLLDVIDDLHEVRGHLQTVEAEGQQGWETIIRQEARVSGS